MIYHYNEIASIDFTFRISLLKYYISRKNQIIKIQENSLNCKIIQENIIYIFLYNEI